MAIYTDKQQREVFHFLFLEKLLKISDLRFYVLKGGVNLRFFFGSPRYSEDMDIDVFGGSVATLKKNGYKILEDASFRRILQTYGIANLIVNDPASAKQTATTQRFKFRLVNEAGEEFPTKVEFSRRDKNDDAGAVQELIPPEVIRSYRRLSYECRHYPGELAALQKVNALAGRAESQARDVFDLYLLYLGGHLHQEKIRQRVSLVDRQKASLALMSLDFESYQGQVVEYLDASARNQYASKKAWDQMTKTVLEMIE